MDKSKSELEMEKLQLEGVKLELEIDVMKHPWKYARFWTVTVPVAAALTAAAYNIGPVVTTGITEWTEGKVATLQQQVADLEEERKKRTMTLVLPAGFDIDIGTIKYWAELLLTPR